MCDVSCAFFPPTQFSPGSGYIEGGTNLIIKGTNLGQKVEDIRAVTVAGVNCVVMATGYPVAKQ